MKCCVTGATGFLGTNLVHQLVARGWEVRAMGLPGSTVRYIETLPVKIIFGDITRREDLDPAVEGVDVVFHVAGDTSFWRKRYARQRQINVTGAVNVAEASLAAGVRRMVHTSTVDALGYNPGGIADETWGTYNYGGMGYNYGDTKHEGERRVRQFNDRGLEVVVIYPGSMVGPYDYTLQFGRLYFDLRDGKVPGCPPGGVGFGHVTEVARAQIAAAEKGRPGEGYICAGVNITYRELFEAIANKFGRHAPSLTLPRSVFVAYGYLMQALSNITNRPPEMDPGQARFMSVQAYYDSGKAVRELGYRIAPLTEMVDDAYEWYRKEGFLE
ncbi:MAG: SDR family oxidoreductase [Spirochaetes bacterium]|nr:SDR family oxidoreductase [Spirochaetota bacterium]